MPRCLSCQRELPASVTACPYCGAESASAQINDALLDQVLSLLANRQKLEAVKVMKTTLNCSLLDAKNAVERLEAEQLAIPPAAQTAVEQAWHAAAKDLLLQGKKLLAVKLCREQTGCSLKEAADQVEALAVRHGINPRSGCLGVLLVAATICSALAIGAVSLSR